MDRLIISAIEYLADTCNKSGLHPTDEDRVKITLKVLHKHGLSAKSNELRLFLESTGWAKQPVKDIIKWADLVFSGGRVQIKHKVHAPSENEVWSQVNA